MGLTNNTVDTTQHLRPHIMPTLNFIKEEMSLPRLSVSISMIGRLLLLVLNIIIIGIIGYYFAYYRGSYRHNLFDEELMMLVCAVSATVNTVIMVTRPSLPHRDKLLYVNDAGDGSHGDLLPPVGLLPADKLC